MIFNIKQGDSSPSLAATLFNSSGQPVNLTDAVVYFNMAKEGTSETLVRKVAVITDATNGAVRYDFTSEDTAVSGKMDGEFEVRKNGRVETYPNTSYIPIQIHRALG